MIFDDTKIIYYNALKKGEFNFNDIESIKVVLFNTIE
jgi:hypothetical protein